ncbi:MAG: hypothetical protein K6E17_01985 [Clostridiales bacterium]|nr:hypothetical protein [Clostridiales bacterium]
MKKLLKTISAFVLAAVLLCLAAAPACAVQEDVYDVSPVLCNPAPSAEAAALMEWMCENYGTRMISGQYLDEGRYGQELEAIAAVTGGLYPALAGLDLMNYSPSSVSLGANPVTVDQALKYWQEGYIITLCWHWRPDAKYMNTEGDGWWGGFYTEKTTFNLEKALNGEDPEGYKCLIRDMDAIASQLERLRDAGVPVLWRPLHEASGGWFWWGASGAEAYIRLYRLMYERFTNEFGLNNLIWVWNGQSAEWYPGDDVVDIIGEDLYPGKHVHDTQEAAFRRCLDYTEARKMILLSECGCIPSPIKCGKDGVVWGAWAVWCYEFVLDGQGNYSGEYTTADLLKRFYEAENVITRKDVPALGRAGAETAEPGQGARTFSFADGTLTGSVSKAGGAVQMRGNENTDTVTITLEVPETGRYILRILQAGIGGYKENDLLLDGEYIGQTIVQGEQEEACDTGPVEISAGTHELTVRAVWGWVTLQTVTLIPEGEGTD